MNGISVDLDKTRILRLDFNAIADIEANTNKSIGEILGSGVIGFDALRTFYWAGLKWTDRKLTIEKAGDILQEYMQNGGDLETLSKHILDALIKSGIIKKNVAEKKTQKETKEN